MSPEAAHAWLERLCGPDAVELGERVLLVAAHPDDDVIGLGARLCRLSRVEVLFVTDGAPGDMTVASGLGFALREDYARARAGEAEAALALAGVPPARVRRLGVIDQGASARIAGIAAALRRLVRESGPEVVIAHAYEGGHPDHDAVACALHLAAASLRREGPAPALVEFTGYHDADGSRARATGSFLPGPTPVSTAVLTPEEVALKARLFAAHATQAAVLRQFPIGREALRPAPAYDFAAAPHPWPPFYETFTTWGPGPGVAAGGWMTGERWRALAAAAAARFEHGGAVC